ncbi:hypothetical protein D3C75_956720 [compost metagenome]
MLLERWQGFTGESLQFRLVRRCGFLLEQLHGFFVGIDLVVDIGLVERLLAPFEDHFLDLVGQRRFIGHADVQLAGDVAELLVGFGVIGDHMLGEGLDVGVLAFFQGQITGDHLGDTSLCGCIDEVIGGSRQCLQRCHAQHQRQTCAFYEQIAHVSLLAIGGATSVSRTVEPGAWV